MWLIGSNFKKYNIHLYSHQISSCHQTNVWLTRYIFNIYLDQCWRLNCIAQLTSTWVLVERCPQSHNHTKCLSSEELAMFGRFLLRGPIHRYSHCHGAWPRRHFPLRLKRHFRPAKMNRYINNKKKSCHLSISLYIMKISMETPTDLS